MNFNQQRTAKELKKQGFRLVHGVAVNNKGCVWSLETCKRLSVTLKNYVLYQNKYLSVPKLVLEAFCGEQYRNGAITYRNGNKKDLSKENVCYTSLFAPNRKELVNEADFITALRCYFDIPANYKVRDKFHTRMFLRMICEKRGFLRTQKKQKGIELFTTYIQAKIWEQNSVAAIAKGHGISVRDCSIIIKGFTNMLINEILADLKRGKLQINEFQPKQQTRTEAIKEYNEILKANGKTPIHLRRKSIKQQLNDIKTMVSLHSTENEH